MEFEIARPARATQTPDLKSDGLSEQKRLELAKLRRFDPLQKLTDAALLDLKPHMRTFELDAGARVFREGEVDDWVFFLLTGEITVSVGNGAARTLKAEQPETMAPLAPGSPRPKSVAAAGKSHFLRVPRSLLEMLLKPAEDDDYRVEEISDDDAEINHRLLFEILDDYRSDRLTIPSLPEVVVRIRKAVADPDSTFEKVDRVVVADPGVAARLVQVANSAAYATVMPVGSVRDAVSRIGLNATREVVTALALNNLFETDSKILKSRMRTAWEHSTRVAAISYHLAQLTRSVNPDLAMLGGLVHDIGDIAIIAHAPQYAELSNGSDLLPRTVNLLRADVGSLILRQWNFPDDLVTVALEAEEWDREAPSADCCDVVLVAQLLSFVGSAELGHYPQVSTVPAFSRLCLDQQKAEKTLALLDSADRSISEMQQVLMAVAA
jgi:HD-like signal output (HDOD) protein